MSNKLMAVTNHVVPSEQKLHGWGEREEHVAVMLHILKYKI